MRPLLRNLTKKDRDNSQHLLGELKSHIYEFPPPPPRITSQGGGVGDVWRMSGLWPFEIGFLQHATLHWTLHISSAWVANSCAGSRCQCKLLHLGLFRGSAKLLILFLWELIGGGGRGIINRHGFFTKWHQTAPLFLFEKTNLDHFLARKFSSFKKWDLGFWGQRRRIWDELEVAETRVLNSVGFLAFPMTKYFEILPHRLLYLFRVLSRPPTWFCIIFRWVVG